MTEILLYDPITAETAKSVDAQLKAAPGDITLRINSPGGDTPAAASIYNMLQRRKESGAKITVLIDGIAASAASWIAMIGDPVIMPENALMMIHLPSGLVVGDAEDMRGLAVVLDKVAQTMISAYANKSGKSRAEIEMIMAAETWFSAQEAVDAGFADVVGQPVAIAARFDPTMFARRAPTNVNELARSYWASRGKVVSDPATAPAPPVLGSAEIDARARAYWEARDKVIH